MIYWGKDFEKFQTVFRPFGAVVDLRPLKDQKFGEDQQNGQMDLDLLSNEEQGEP
jgi:hypothetical protein